MKNNIQLLIDTFKESLETHNFQKLTLSHPRLKSAEIKQISLKEVISKKRNFIQITYIENKKPIQKNFTSEGAIYFIINELEHNFLNAYISTKIVEGYYMSSKKGNSSLKWKNNTTGNLQRINPLHDREKTYLIAKDAPFLQHLGVTSTSHHLIGAKSKKYRQINKFIEIFAQLTKDHITTVPFKIVDMGCGSGYLTFALYHFLNSNGWKQFSIKGFDIKKELMDKNNEIAKLLNFKNLSFHQSNILEIPSENFDMVIALHACDTATDDALAYAVNNKCAYILAAPCCQKQVRKNMNLNKSPFNELLKDGIIKERFASDLTDLIRSQTLQLLKYQSSIMEFISQEETPKNLMITAKYTGTENQKAKKNILKWMADFGIEKHALLEKLNLSLD